MLNNKSLRHALPQRVPFFYGYVMLALASLSYMFTTPGQTAGVSAFNPSLRETLDLSLTQLTGMYALGTFLASLPQTYIGSLMDRYGPRRVLIGVVIMFGVACMFTAQVRNIWMLLIAFMMLRMFGQGALGALSSNTIAFWFDKRLGTMQGVSNIAMAVATGTFPLAFLWGINQIGWRGTYTILGLILWVVLLPLLWIVYHNYPSDLGLQIDGDSIDADTELDPVSNIGFTLQQALRTPTFWIFLGTIFTVGLTATAIAFNVLPFYLERGLTEYQAASTFSVQATVMTIALFIGGILSDRIQLHKIIAVSMLVMTLAFGYQVYVDSLQDAYIVAVLQGLGQGALNSAIVPAWAKYFGRAHLGKIRGFVATCMVAGTSMGPFLMGYTYDIFGNYSVSLWIFTAMVAPFMVLALFAVKPELPATQP